MLSAVRLGRSERFAPGCPGDTGEEGAQLFGVEVDEQAAFGGREVLPDLAEAGAAGVGDEDLAGAAVARVGAAGHLVGAP